MRRSERLAAMLAEHGIKGIIELLQPSIEKYGYDRTVDRWRLPLRATRKLLEAFQRGEQYIPPAGKEKLLCGAMTRTGTPCKRKPIPGKKRCRNHGGLSTGAKTPEGKRKIAFNLPCVRARHGLG